MIEHARARGLLATHEDLTASERAALAAHLAHCAACRRTADEYSRQDLFLRNLSFPDPPMELRHGVFARIGRASAVPHHPARSRWPLLTAVFVLLTLVAGALPRPRPVPLGLPPATNLKSHAGPQLRVAQDGSYRHGPLSRSPVASPINNSAGDMGVQAGIFAPAASSTWDVHSVTADGLRLTLTVLDAAVPHNALVPVTVDLKNVTDRSQRYFGGGTPCGGDQPWVETVSGNGKILYPPATKIEAVRSCPAIRPSELRPSHEVRVHLFAPARAPYLRAAVRLFLHGRRLATRPIALHILPESAPHISLQTSPRVQAVVHAGTSAQRGRLYVSEVSTCTTGNISQTGFGGPGLTPTTDEQWESQPGTVVRPMCAHPYRWSLVAGWPGHPTAELEYHAPH